MISKAKIKLIHSLESKKHRKSAPVQTPVQTPKPSPTQTQQLYTSIQQFKRDFPKKTIYDLFKKHIDSGRVGRNYSDRNIFNRELFDNQEHERRRDDEGQHHNPKHF